MSELPKVDDQTALVRQILEPLGEQAKGDILKSVNSDVPKPHEPTVRKSEWDEVKHDPVRRQAYLDKLTHPHLEALEAHEKESRGRAEERRALIAQMDEEKRTLLESLEFKIGRKLNYDEFNLFRVTPEQMAEGWEFDEKFGWTHSGEVHKDKSDSHTA